MTSKKVWINLYIEIKKKNFVKNYSVKRKPTTSNELIDENVLRKIWCWKLFEHVRQKVNETHFVYDINTNWFYKFGDPYSDAISQLLDSLSKTVVITVMSTAPSNITFVGLGLDIVNITVHFELFFFFIIFMSYCSTALQLDCYKIDKLL